MISKVFFLLTFSAFAHASSVDALFDTLIQQARSRSLSGQTQWLRLGHYRKGVFGGYKSQADGMKFFLSPQGKTDPQSELEATLRGFFSNAPLPPGEQHPQCQFPARYLWLKRELKIDEKTLPHPDCSRYRKFHDNVAAKSATVVFSSYYLNNPSSAFGHSFLRLNQAEAAYAGRRYELLDYGISYAANYAIGNPLLYAIYGVFGMIPGQFTSIPYYYKVREYNDFEARDLWEYDLNLTAEQTDFMVAHIWELGSTYFDYYYLSENCSYHVLSILEAANPALNLIDRLPSIVIPADTMRVLMKSPGLVTHIHFRPSIRKQFEQRVKTLSDAQLKELKSLIRSRSSDSSDVATLDAAIDYMDVRYNKELLSADSEPSVWKQKLLVARSKIPVQSEDLSIPTPEQEMPHLGHESARAGVEYGFADQTKNFARVDFRFALHDHLDPSPGYPEYAEIDFLPTKLRYNYVQKSFWLDDFSLIRAISLSPITPFSQSLSWKVNVGARTIRDLSCNGCLAGSLSAGGGYTVSLVSNLTLTGMLEAESTQSPDFDRFFLRTGLGPSLMLRASFSPMVHGIAYASYKYEFPTGHPHSYEFGAEIRAALFKDFALNAKITRFPVGSEYAGGALYYF